MEIPLLSRLDIHIREVVEKASVALVLKVAGSGLSFLFSVLLARMLGPSGAGLYFLGIACITVASVLARMGMDNALLRYVAARSSEEDWRAVKGVYRKGMSLAGGAALLVSVILFVFAPLVATVVFSEPELTAPLRWMVAAVLPFTLLNLHSEVLRGLKNIRDAQLVQGVGVPLVSVIGLVILARSWGVTGAVWAHVIGCWATFLVGVWLWRRSTPQLRELAGAFELDRLLDSSLPLFGVSAMNLVMGWTATVVLGIWATSDEVGIYNVASRTARLTSFVLAALNSIVAPKFAALYEQGELEDLEQMAQTVAGIMMLTAGPILLVFVLVPDFVMRLFGEGFQEGGLVLAIIAGGKFVNAATGSVGFLLMMSGHERLMRNNIFGAAVLNVALNVTLVPAYGLPGAAVASAASLAVMNVVSAILVYRYLDVMPIPLPGRRRGPGVPPAEEGAAGPTSDDRSDRAPGR